MIAATHPVAKAMLCALLSLIPHLTQARVVVTEIMYTPGSTEPEWVELYNMADSAVTLADWTVQDRSTSKPIIPRGTIPARGYFILTRDSTLLKTARAPAAPMVQITLPSLNNTGDDVILRDAAGRTVDSVAFASSWGGTGGLSLERIDFPRPSNDPTSWGSCVDTTRATAGRRNSIAPLAHDLRIDTLRFDPESSLLAVVVANTGAERSVGATAMLYHDADRNGEGIPDEIQSARPVAPIAPGDSLTVLLPWRRPLTIDGEPALVVVDHPTEERIADNDAALTIRERFVDTGVIVNEIMAAPTAPEPEWIELHNRGDYPVDLAGWTVHDLGASRPKIRAGILPPGAFAVVVKDSASLVEERIILSPIIVMSLPSLGNTGDAVVLRTPSGNVVDSVGYRSSWGGGGGASLERREIDRPSTDSASWGGAIDSSRATPGRANSLVPPVMNLDLFGVAFDHERSVIVASVRSTGKKATVAGTLRIVVDGVDPGSPGASRDVNVPAVASGDTLDLSVPWDRSLTLGGERVLLHLLIASDERTRDDTTTMIVREKLVDTGLVVTEIMADPNDPEPEWIELYNRGMKPVDLTGWRVRDGTSGSQPIGGGIVMPGTYRVMTTDTAELRRLRAIDGELVQLSFPSLNNSGDAVILRNGSGRTIDSVRYKASWGIDGGLSLERKSVGAPSNDSSAWIGSHDPSGATPGRKSSYAPVLRDLSIVAATFDPLTSSISLSLTNRGIDAIDSAHTLLYYDIDGDGVGSAGEEIARDTIPLLSPGDTIDMMLPWSRPLIESGEKGIVAIVLDADERPGDNIIHITALPLEIDDGIIINEIMYEPASGEPEWVELYNRNDRAVRLDGWVLYDGGSARPTIASASLPARSYLVLTADSAALALARPLFGPAVECALPSLNNSGDDIVLRNRAGAVVDSLHYRDGWGGQGGFSLERRETDLPSNDSASWGSSIDGAGATAGWRNSLLPPDLNIALASVAFDPDRSIVAAVIVNEGERMSIEGEASLYVDANADGIGDDAERELGWTIAAMAPGASTTLELPWSRALFADGEPALVVIRMAGDERSDDDALPLIIRMRLADDGLIVNEVMAAPDGSEPEWIEILNAGERPVLLDGWRVHDAASSVMIRGAALMPGAFAVVTADAELLRSARSLPASAIIIDAALPSLNNSEDDVRLVNPNGITIDSLRYRAGWFGARGLSLERRHPSRPTNDSTSWRPSSAPDGATPGLPNAVVPPRRNVGIDSIRFDGKKMGVITSIYNEGLEDILDGEIRLYHDRDHDGFGIDAEEVARVPMPALGFDATSTIELAWPRDLTDSGERSLIDLVVPDDADPEDDTASLALLLPPPTSGLLITEIMFDPLSIGEEIGSDYVEVRNMNDRPLPLAGWRLRDGAGTTVMIPDSMTRTLPPGGYGVIAGSASLRNAFPLIPDSAVVIVLDRALGLNATDDDVVLINPSGEIVDSVHYDDAWHWAELGDTKGIALERLTLDGDGNDATRWSSSVAPLGGTPGERNARMIEPVAGDRILLLSSETLSPDGDGVEDFVRIVWNLPVDAARVFVEVYDRSGRRVARPVDNAPSPAVGEVIWDGRDAEGRVLAVGVYIVRIEFYGDGGKGYAGEMRRVVIAREL